MDELSPGGPHINRVTGRQVKLQHDVLTCTCYLCRQIRYHQRQHGLDRPEPDWEVGKDG
jgi:hypothetical protein